MSLTSLGLAVAVGSHVCLPEAGGAATSAVSLLTPTNTRHRGPETVY